MISILLFIRHVIHLRVKVNVNCKGKNSYFNASCVLCGSLCNAVLLVTWRQVKSALQVVMSWLNSSSKTLKQFKKYDIHRLKNERLTNSQSNTRLITFRVTFNSFLTRIYTDIEQHVCVCVYLSEQQAASLSVKPCYYVFLACTTPFFLYNLLGCCYYWRVY